MDKMTHIVGNSYLGIGTYKRFNKYHIFLNPSFDYYFRTNYDLGFQMRKHKIDHSIHIFISSDIRSLHDGTFIRYMKLCSEKVSNKVIIHLPKWMTNSVVLEDFLKTIVLKGLDNYEIIIHEGESFRYDVCDKTFIDIEFCKTTDTSKAIDNIRYRFRKEI